MSLGHGRIFGAFAPAAQTHGWQADGGTDAFLYPAPKATDGRGTQRRRRPAGALLSLGVLVVIVLPFARVAAFTVSEAIGGFSYVRDTLGVQSVSDLKTVQLPLSVQKALRPRDSASTRGGKRLPWPLCVSHPP